MAPRRKARIASLAMLPLLLGCVATPDAPPPLNPLEAKIVDALATLGIHGQRAEYSFRGAIIWATLEGGSELFVSAQPPGVEDGDFVVVAERPVQGIVVQRVEYPAGQVRDRFACADATYQVETAVPPGAGDPDALLSRVIAALDCGKP